MANYCSNSDLRLASADSISIRSLPLHPQRDTLNQFYDQITYDSSLTPAKINKIYDLIGALDGLSIFERREVTQDAATDFSCHTYALQKIVGNVPTPDDIIRFAAGPEKFLEALGYSAGNEFVTGAFVAYCDTIEHHGKTIVRTYRHYGIVAPDQLVISKWDHGHIYKHPLNAVPARFGDHVVVFNPSR